MKNTLIKFPLMLVLLLAVILFLPDRALAHCDTMDGPVVRAAKQALLKRNVNLVLIWVQKKDEAEVRQVFREVLAVRSLNRQARSLADKYFFESVVRIHRVAEGESYTGLKPAGTEVSPVISVADQAIATGSVDSLLKLFPENAHTEIRDRFQDAVAKKIFNKDDVESGRRFTASYISFLHYLEHLYEERAGH
jgi:hypothetical protein